MKYSSFLVLVALLPIMALAQPKTTVKKDKPPTKAEMDQMTKDLQKAMGQMDPAAKRYLDSLGIKIPTGNNLPAYTDATLAKAAADEERVFPVRRADLIAKVPKAPPSDAELLATLNAFNAALSKHISPEKKAMGDKVLTQFGSDKHAWAMIAATANGMWVLGMHTTSIYLMGKAAVAMPNSDNLNNLAAYLTMVGAPHKAIPILDRLNQVHPGNSTVLNNLGQAWIGLGDITRGEKYLDEAIIAYPYHPQANYSKALILAEHGKTTEAIAAIKRSLQHSVTEQKLNKLRKWEGRTKPPYYPQRGKLQTYTSSTFSIYKYLDRLPLIYAQSAGKELDKPWQIFFEEMHEEADRLQASIHKNKDIASRDVLNAGKKAVRNGIAPFSPYYMQVLNDEGHGLSGDEVQRSVQREQETATAYLTQWATLSQAFHHSLDSARDKIERDEPAGSALLLNSCPVTLPIVNKYITEINKLNKNYRELNVRRWYTEAYKRYNYLMTTAPTASVALDAVLHIKLELVNKLLTLKHESYDMPECVQEETLEVQKSNGPLTDFDEAHCATTSTLYVPMTGFIRIRCNEMTMYFNSELIPVSGGFTSVYVGNKEVVTSASIAVGIKGVDITAEGEFNKDGSFKEGKLGVKKEIAGVGAEAALEFDEKGFKKGSVELGIDGELDLVPQSIKESAPLDMGMKGALAVGIELSDKGIEDWYVKEDTKLNMGASVETDFQKEAKEAKDLYNEIDAMVDPKGKLQAYQPKLSTGAEVKTSNRWGVNSGYTVERETDFTWIGTE